MRTLGASLVTAVVSVVLFAAPAHAQTRSVDDAVDNDVAAYSDIVGLHAQNGEHAFVATIRLRDVKANKTSAYVLINAHKSVKRHGTKKRVRLAFSVGTESSGHRHHPILVRHGSEDSDDPVRCAGLRVLVLPSLDGVYVRVPQHCLGGGLPRVSATRVSALTETPGGGSDADWTSSLKVHRG